MPQNEINGILLVDKPKGFTSHDIVNKLRYVLQIKKIGHAGTLDPEATGLLIMLIGKATKSSADFLGLDKIYEVELTLGVKTSTADHTGEILEQKEVKEFSPDAINGIINTFKGVSEQIPPMMSAKKINGKKLYVLARKGIEVERKPQKILISDIKVTKIDLRNIWFTVHCSKGTYIRTLCEDIGGKLGCGGHMSGLRRTAIGKFKVHDAFDGHRLHREFKQEIEEKVISL
ncbi:MAG: tRNA pseudouridine(55) synthase TruB [Candidatus Omnitrophota bacterium]